MMDLCQACNDFLTVEWDDVADERDFKTTSHLMNDWKVGYLKLQ